MIVISKGKTFLRQAIDGPHTVVKYLSMSTLCLDSSSRKYLTATRVTQAERDRMTERHMDGRTDRRTE